MPSAANVGIVGMHIRMCVYEKESAAHGGWCVGQRRHCIAQLRLFLCKVLRNLTSSNDLTKLHKCPYMQRSVVCVRYCECVCFRVFYACKSHRSWSSTAVDFFNCHFHSPWTTTLADAAHTHILHTYIIVSTAAFNYLQHIYLYTCLPTSICICLRHFVHASVCVCLCHRL